MFRKRDDIRIINPESIILFLIVLLGLLIFDNSVKSSPEAKKSVSTEVSVTLKNADIWPVVRLQVFQNNRYSDKVVFRLPSYNMISFLEDKRTDLKIITFQKIRDNSDNVALNIFRCHLFPQEEDKPLVFG